MSSNNNNGRNSPGNETVITLDLLNAVEKNSSVTQRSLASELDIALGLANAYFKRCAKKGFIKIQQVPRNRLAYYLTPKGFAEKGRLTSEFLSQSLNFFRIARQQCTRLLEECIEAGQKKVVLVGIGDLTEITTLCARNLDIEIINILDIGDYQELSFAGCKVAKNTKDLAPFDVLIITEMNGAQQVFDRLLEDFGSDMLLTPAVLNISRFRRDLTVE
jgi:predicted transcriptional regulator